MWQDIFDHCHKVSQWQRYIRGIERRYALDRVKLDTRLVQSRTAQCSGFLIFRYSFLYLAYVVTHDSQIQILSFPANASRHCSAYPAIVLRGLVQKPL